MPLRSILFVLIFVIFAFLRGTNLDSISNIWSVVCSCVNVFFIVLLFLICRGHGGLAGLINYAKGKTKVRQIVGMTFLILCVGMFGMYLSGFICYGIIPYSPPMMIAPIPLWLAVVNLFVLPVSTAVAEDSLYLGCGVNQIENKYLSVIVPAFFFAVQHSFIPFLLDWKFVLYRFLSFLPLTVILCVIYRRNKNPLPIMVGHAIIDLATAVQIVLTSGVPGFYEKMCSL